ncbi:hypothetical protein [Planotetraspora kaengkrachanensis]|uniref:Uncharacterized protein n=1 Tax=Planotetraspora kaengkrachanensis TaxID=575193 RepID=A0A8J3V8U9_9ACTN|nr:hypothetical protein [Planotetraspora kaengkrachanensis]GIG82347.1 hypothetical protein Pka01_54740 [Planotetraspora kaengkrachanensis]
MPPPEVEELKSRALKIHKLADDVEKLANVVHTEAGRMEWSGPLTDRVRGEIRTWKTRCGNAAELLREEADRLNSQARDMLKP